MRFLWGFWRTWNYLFLRRKKSEPVIRISTAVESPSPSVNTHYNVTGEMMIEVRWQNARQIALGGHEGYHLRSACLAYLLGSFMWKTLSSISFPPSSIPSPPRCGSRLEAKRLLDNNVIVAKLTLLKDASSSAPVTQESEGTLASLRREKDDVGRLGSLENVIEDEFAAWDEPRVEGVDVPRCDGKFLLVDDAWWERTVETVGEHCGGEIIQQSRLL